ncbi:Coq4 family protein [Caulobacter sp. Root1472]|uniref:Coq4 family protein n=1 Tax=Caulobacter sp. Root1472 TaxID=1736470 RepID=UPI0009E8969B|nr:Coq4 family protein [Caulobacter sp. Root1472]
MTPSIAGAQIDKPLVARRDWGGAFAALRKLMANKHDTEQVFVIMSALNADEDVRLYKRLLTSRGGGQVAYRRVELAEKLMDRTWLERFEPDTVGGVYRAFLDATGYSAEGLAEISQAGASDMHAEHPYVWMGRRTRDVHDLWHVLTGYKADEHLGEASLVAFSFAQLGGWGWAAIALASWLETLPGGLSNPQGQAIWEGYRLGRKAVWLVGEDYEKLLGERLIDARRRLRIGTPERYFAIPQAVRATSLGQGREPEAKQALLSA